jgi:hypothetical protein
MYYAAYAAGLLDGEGHIGIVKKSLRKGRRLREIYAEVRISMTDEATVQWLKDHFGGGILRLKRHSQHPHWQDMYRWDKHSLKATEFLREVLPYLITKRAQAELAIEFQARVDEWGSSRYHMGTKGFRPLPDEVIAMKEDYFQRMQVLNLMGRGYEERKAILQVREKENAKLASELSIITADVGSFSDIRDV